MLTELIIQNFGLIDHADLCFSAGLNILTGETGAGKSIIIDGLRFALGERLRSSQIRDARQSCYVEAVFALDRHLIEECNIFQEIVDPEERVLIIRREVLSDGRTRIKVNGNALTVAQLKDLGNHLIDFHGPHDHQMLLAREHHLMMLDRLIDFNDVKPRYEEEFRTYVDLKARLQDLQAMGRSRERELDFLSHQLKELDQVPLEAERYQELMQRHARISNTERLAQAASSFLSRFENEEAGIAEQIRQSFSPCRVLTDNDNGAAALEELLNTAQETAETMIAQLHQYLDGLSFEPGEAEDLNRMYDIYEDLKRKYGPTLDDVAAFSDQARAKHEALVNLEHNDAQLRRELGATEENLRGLSAQMSAQRQSGARLLETTIEQELRDLGIQHVDFEVRFNTAAFTREGCDQVEFFISPNAGEPLKPLAEIVSSGEAARLMLALKKALTHVDPIPVLIFDEIDAQIGGRLGQMTGRKLKELSRNRQVILITHLPQIAAFGDRHFHVGKVVRDGKTYTDVTELADDQRLVEVAQMMGASQSGNSGDYWETVLSHAREMLVKAGLDAET